MSKAKRKADTPAEAPRAIKKAKASRWYHLFARIPCDDLELHMIEYYALDADSTPDAADIVNAVTTALGEDSDGSAANDILLALVENGPLPNGITKRGQWRVWSATEDRRRLRHIQCRSYTQLLVGNAGDDSEDDMSFGEALGIMGTTLGGPLK
jgi:hypothetical protein